MTENQKGFTLIELLITVAVIGLLASAIITTINSSRPKARDAKRIADMKALHGALEMYIGDKGTYPAAIAATTASGWTSFMPDTGDTSLTAYLPSLPIPPAVDNSTACGTKTYRYGTDTNKTDYALQFCLSANTGNYKAGLNYLTPSKGVLNSSTTPTSPTITVTPVW